jgi:DNA-binding SARP family transcriptional activator
MAACRLILLGGFTLTGAAGEALALPTRKDRLLLAHLVLAEGHALDRSRLAGMLWRDRGESQARDSLRQSLAALKQAFRAVGIDPLLAERDSIVLKVEALDVDALRFIALAEAAPAAAIAAYSGVLLEGTDGLSTEFDAWLLPEHERLDALAARALQNLAAATPSPEERNAGIALGRRMLARDPTREPIMRALM